MPARSKSNRKKNGRIADAKVHEFDLWCHAEEATKPSREDAVKRLHDILARLVRHADKEHLKLAPFVGIACPGVIAPDGHIERGGQNLPGNWESNRFNLPARIRELLPNIGKHETTIVMHNDAVVQGLSELPFIQDVTHLGRADDRHGFGQRGVHQREGRFGQAR